MKVVVEDANVLLDLVNGGLLGLWLGVEFKNSTTHLVWEEVALTHQRQEVQPFIDSGLLTLDEIQPQSWEEIFHFSNSCGVSISDASVWFIAKSERAILLTGDSKLRKSAKAVGVEVRGVLWVLDELVVRGKILPSSATLALNKMIADGSFLPSEECRLRRSKWASP